MINKKILLTIIIVALIAFATFYYFATINSNKPASAIYTSLEEYNYSIDYSCTIDSDCVIKNVGNCCGAYPKCVNKNAVVDPKFVDRACSKENLGGVCGYPSVNDCICASFKGSNPKCEGIFRE